MDTSVSVDRGLATLGPEAITLLERLDRRFVHWGQSRGAERWLYPPLMTVADLTRLDYFRNFPHLGVVVSRIRDGHVREARGLTGDSIPESQLQAGEFLLPSAACYNVYLHLRDSTLDAARYVTTVARCFRNEDRFDGLQRLWGFTMREIVCVGTQDAVRQHIDWFTAEILAFATRLGIALVRDAAEDPFFEGGLRKQMQQLAPVKYEFRYGGTLAVASVNMHRNFFGERCNIRLSDGSFAFSGCVAFGLERWLQALIDHCGSTTQALGQLSEET